MFRSAKGITLMELVAILVVAGVAIPVLMRAEAIGDAAFYAQGLMEEVRSKRFDERDAAPWSSSLGIDAGESAVNASTFDDVDDFVNATDPRITAPAAGFRRGVAVAYVYRDANNTWQPCAPSPSCAGVTDCSGCTQCCFKQVTVSVQREGADAGNISLATIVAGF